MSGKEGLAMKFKYRITAFVLMLTICAAFCGCAVRLDPAAPMSSADEASIMGFVKDKSPSEVRVGEYIRLKVRIKSDCEPYVQWYSSNPDVATVDSNGRVDGIKEGEVTITAKAKTAELDFSVKVKEAKVQALKDSTALEGNDTNMEILAKNLQNENKKNPYALLVNLMNNTIIAYTYDGDGDYNKAVRQMICATDANNNVLKEYDYYISTKERWHKDEDGRYYQFATSFSEEFRFCTAPYTEEGAAFLIAEEYNKIGTECTKGDIWLSAADAEWIYLNCGEGTRVKIYDKSLSPIGAPKPLKLTENSLSMKWDPTDPSEKNPYKDKVPTFKGVDAVTVKLGGAFDSMNGVVAVDTCSAESTSGILVDGSVMCNKAGTYVISYYYTDSLNRTGRADRVVTVE